MEPTLNREIYTFLLILHNQQIGDEIFKVEISELNFFQRQLLEFEKKKKNLCNAMYIQSAGFVS